jgi:dihydrodipicolinate synthase/N-acetylneuraminate lyase
LQRLHAALTAPSGGPAAHLTPADRRAVVEIVAETVAGVPAWWK